MTVQTSRFLFVALVLSSGVCFSEAFCQSNRIEGRPNSLVLYYAPKDSLESNSPKRRRGRPRKIDTGTPATSRKKKTTTSGSPRASTTTSAAASGTDAPKRRRTAATPKVTKKKPAKARQAPKKGLLRRGMGLLFKGALCIVGLAVVLTLLYGVVNPPTTPYMFM